MCVADTAPVDSAAPDTDDTDDTTGDSAADTATDTGADTAAPAPIEVWILGGQSNMDGYSYQTGLPPAWRLDAPDIPLYWSGWGTFRALAPASYGGGYLTGPEVSMGRTLAEGGARVALVKHAVNVSYLATDWYPGDYPEDPAAAWTGFVATMRGAAAELDAAGEPWRWAGLAWMQGESDATTLETASAYETNLTTFIARVRDEAGTPDLPVAIGLIACDGLCVYVEEVRAAQQAVADADPAAALVVDAVPSRYQAPTSYRDGFWYVAIDPVTLPAGRYTIGLVSWQGDQYAIDSTATVGAGVTFESAAYHDGFWLSYPEQVGATSGGVGFLGPGFLYDEG